MLVLHSWGTTNGRKPIIALEELGLAYKLVPVDITRGVHQTDAFRTLNPLGKIPVLIDPDTGPIFESSAILWHLAHKTRRLLGDLARPHQLMQALFLQAATVQPPLSHYWHLKHRLPERPPSELARHRAEVLHVLAALETLLNAREYFAGSYSVADILMLPHIHRELAEPEHDHAYPALRAWLARLEARPAVRKGLTLEIG